MTTFEKANSLQQKLKVFAGEVMTHKSLLFCTISLPLKVQDSAFSTCVTSWSWDLFTKSVKELILLGAKDISYWILFSIHLPSEIFFWSVVVSHQFWVQQKKHIPHFISIIPSVISVGHDFLVCSAALWCFHTPISIHTSSTSTFLLLSRVFQSAFQQWAN